MGYSFTFLLLIAERTVGWRAVYYIAGVPSVVIGFLILFTVRDPPRGGEDNKNEKPVSIVFEIINDLLSISFHI